MRAILLSLLLLGTWTGQAPGLDWSRYGSDPGTLSPPLAFHRLAVTTTDSVKVAAWFLPAQDSADTAGSGRHPGVVVLPREGETLSDRLPLIAALSRRGFAVLAFDHRGQGASEPFRTDPRALVYPEYRIDASSALDVLWRRPEVDTARVGVIGESRGAVLALALAGRRPEVRAVVAVGAPRDWKTYLESLEKMTPDQEYFVPGGWERRDDPDRVIRRFNGAILFVTGNMDTETPTWMARELYEKYPRPKELWIVEDAGHAGDRTPERRLGEAYYDRVAAFLRRELDKKPHRGWPYG
jgi:pimeloyl-ACP methyl ester carboxylesterase